jgi:hypothetical protein
MASPVRNRNRGTKQIMSIRQKIRLRSVQRGWNRIPREYAKQIKSFKRNEVKLLKWALISKDDYYAIHDKILWTYAVKAAMAPIRNYWPKIELEPGGFRDSLEKTCLSQLSEELGVSLDEIHQSRGPV